jgi:hypothetical protein
MYKNVHQVHCDFVERPGMANIHLSINAWKRTNFSHFISGKELKEVDFFRL